MEVIRNTNSVPYEKTVVALGNFDGIHKAHMAIIKGCCRYAKANGIKSGILLFSEHTLSIIRGKRVKLITQEREKLRLLEQAGLDFAYICDFTDEFMHLKPNEFAKMLKDTLNVDAVCVGYDYRFGYKAKGDTTLLSELGDIYGFDVLITEELDHDGVAIKSTAVRNFVTAGSMQHAASLLGRPFSIHGIVEHGLQNGKKLGFPTANLKYDIDMVIPPTGVYMGYTYVDGVKYKSVINIGDNPTFNAKKVTIESHILNFTGDIYGKEVCVEFIKRIRGDKKFKSLDELKQQIQNDAEKAGKELM